MSGVLVDTSVWIEYFAPRTKLQESTLASLWDWIIEGEVSIIEPIRAEILSGEIAKREKREIFRLLDALNKRDLDWNEPKTWDDIIGLAHLAKSRRLPVPGLVDRMILLAAFRSQNALLTMDGPLKRLAGVMGLDVVAA